MNKSSLKIQRKTINKKSKKFKYVDQTGTVIKNKKELERINKLVIPPNYKNVLISKTKKSNIQAIGYDDKGRRQYVYNKTYTQKNSDRKFKNYVILGKYLPKIKKDLSKKMNILLKKPYNQWEQPESNIAIVVYLLNNCYFRIGNMKYYKDNNSHGILTLQKKHIKILNNNKFKIEFIGKKGVNNCCIKQDKKLYTILKKLKTNNNEFLFDYNNTHLSNEFITNYLKDFNEDITPKMFRTWHTNCFFVSILKKNIDSLIEIQSMSKTANEKNKKKLFKKIIVELSEKFYNTPNVVKKSYLNNSITKLFFTKTDKLLNIIKKNKSVKCEKILMHIENII